MTLKPKKHTKLSGLLRDQRGLTTVEYIIILCLIAVVGFGIWKKFGEAVKDKVGGARDTIGTLQDTQDDG